ncbi:MAG: hypothetical protein DRJ03_01915 [Chloroflexi bacterium]|nr:MAG: hypothetical protein DRJ03_01915 [Chloroflexota bacterium]
MDRSFFNPRLPFMRPPGERWDALFDQYHTSLRNAGLGGLGTAALTGLVGYLVAKRIAPGAGALGAAAGVSVGFPAGLAGGGHLTYESMRDTIPLTKQELREQDPMYRIKRLLKFKGV